MIEAECGPPSWCRQRASLDACNRFLFTHGIQVEQKERKTKK